MNADMDGLIIKETRLPSKDSPTFILWGSFLAGCVSWRNAGREIVRDLAILPWGRRKISVWTGKMKGVKKGFMSLLPLGWVIILVFCGSKSYAATSAINVYFSTTSLQSDFIQNATSQYTGALTASTFFPNTYTFQVTGKNQGYTPPAPPTSLNGDYYLYGWGSGSDYSRFQDYMAINSSFVMCSSSTWSSIVTDTQTCANVIGQIASEIYQLHTGSPTIVPNF